MLWTKDFFCGDNICSTEKIESVTLLMLLICSPCLHMKIMNYSGAIDVSLSYKTYTILVRPRHFEVLK